MPRRSGGSRPAMSNSRPLRQPVSNVPAKSASNVPMAQSSNPTAMQQKQPGLFAQMATTAAGVAVGSAVGHTLGAAMMGGGRGDEQQQIESYQPQSGIRQNENNGPCFYQMKQFMDCAQNQYDLSLCQGFNQALKECKMSNGLLD